MRQSKKSNVKRNIKKSEKKTPGPSRVDDRGKQEQRSIRLNNLFDNFRRDVEGAMNPWSYGPEWRFPRRFSSLQPFSDEQEIVPRAPLIDMVDKGDRYHLRMEFPGIDKDGIHLTATDDSIEVAAEQEREVTNDEQETDNYIYNERSYQSFYRSIPMPEEIIPSDIKAKMHNGILQIDIPKRDPSRIRGTGKRIEIQ